MNHRHMTPRGGEGAEPARDEAGAWGPQASRPAPLQPGSAGRREAPLPRGRPPPPQTPPAGFRGTAGLTAFSCSSRSFILPLRRPEASERVPGERVPGERPEVATGPGRGEGARGAGRGRRRRPARRSVRGRGRLRRTAPCGPAGAARSKSGCRAGAAAQRGSARGPAPYLGRAPCSSLKGPCPSAARPLPATRTAPALAPRPSRDRRSPRSRPSTGTFRRRAEDV